MGVLLVIGLVSEVLSWITLVGGGLCLLAFAFARIADGTWEPTDAVIVDVPGGRRARWFAEGEFHERDLDEEELAQVGPEEARRAFYRRRTPERLRFEAESPLPRMLGGLAVILLSIGLVTTVVSIVAGVID